MVGVLFCIYGNVLPYMHKTIDENDVLWTDKCQIYIFKFLFKNKRFWEMYYLVKVDKVNIFNSIF